MIIRIFITGWIILIVAIILNIVALKMGYVTWYSFSTDMLKSGFIKSFMDISIISKFYLFVVYPIVLGFFGFLVLRKTDKKK